MAVPFDNATTLLTDTSAAVRQVYHEKFLPMMNRFGGKTNRVFMPTRRRVDGDGLNIQVMDRNLYAARMDTDINADFPTPRSFSAATYKITLSETPSSNHFRRVALSLQTSWLDIKRVLNKKASAVDYVKELTTQSMANLGESIALHRHLDSTGKLGTLSGTATKNDNRFWASASAISTTGGGRVVVTGGSIASFPPGLVMSVYNGSTYVTDVIVTDYNPQDNSVGLYGVSAAFPAGDSSISLSGLLTSGYDLYISSEYNKNILSFGHWFSEPSSGESFFGLDRTTATNRWIIPHTSGPAASTLFSKTHLDDWAIEMGFIREEEDAGGYVALTTPQLEQRYRNQIGQDILIDFPSGEQKGKLIAQYGFDGSLYRHPTAGRVVLQADAFATPNTIRFLRVGDWETAYAPTEGGEQMGFEWLPGDINDWYRMPSSTPGNGFTTTFRMDGLLLMVDFCVLPRLQSRIRNVTAT